jgi:hypothetical protein
VFMILSSLLVKDYMSWQRARLGATNFLQYDSGISKSRIDGGLEFNAYNFIYGWNPHPLKTTDKSWWFVDKDDFVITSGDLDGYEKWKGFPTYPTISTGPDSVYILKKIEMDTVQ